MNKYQYLWRNIILFVQVIYVDSCCHLNKVIIRQSFKMICSESCIKDKQKEKEIVERYTNAIHYILTNTFCLADKTCVLVIPVYLQDVPFANAGLTLMQSDSQHSLQ